MSYSSDLSAERWFSTPCGPMRQFEPVASPSGDGHWYIDRDQHWRAFPDSACKPTRAPAWYRRQTIGEALLAARRAARAS